MPAELCTCGHTKKAHEYRGTACLFCRCAEWVQMDSAGLRVYTSQQAMSRIPDWNHLQIEEAAHLLSLTLAERTSKLLMTLPEGFVPVWGTLRVEIDAAGDADEFVTAKVSIKVKPLAGTHADADH